MLQITAVSANLRGGPGTGYPIVGSASGGDALTVQARHTSGQWLQVRRDARDAWVAAGLGTLSGGCANLPVSTLPLRAAADSGSGAPEDVHDADEIDTPDDDDDDDTLEDSDDDDDDDDNGTPDNGEH